MSNWITPVRAQLLDKLYFYIIIQKVGCKHIWLQTHLTLHEFNKRAKPLTIMWNIKIAHRARKESESLSEVNGDILQITVDILDNEEVETTKESLNWMKLPINRKIQDNILNI